MRAGICKNMFKGWNEGLAPWFVRPSHCLSELTEQTFTLLT